MTESPTTVVGAGDAALTRGLVDEDETLTELIRSADASVVNLEAPLIAENTTPAAFNNGLYLQSPPWTLDELVEYGFDLFAAASNHSGDFLQEGIASTLQTLEDRNANYAGLGQSLSAARAPCYTSTRQGRIALVAVTASVKRGIQAGPSRHDQNPRAGVAPLRTRTVYQVEPEYLEQLREISDALGLEALKSELGVSTTHGNSQVLLDVDTGNSIPFAVGDETRIVRRLIPQDAKPILDAVSQARKRADHVIVSVHAHQGRDGSFNDQSVPEFLESFAHDCVRMGADVVFGHGPHVVRGIDTFDGAPIFYSLGNFALQFETTDQFPAEMYNKHGVDDQATPEELVEEIENGGSQTDVLAPMRKTRMAVLPVVELGESTSVRLYPLDLGVDEEAHHRGQPSVAGPEVATELFDDLVSLSERFGTEIEVTDGVGRIELSSTDE